MRKLLNTLYVTSPDSYLSLDGENVVIYDNDTELGRIPLHNLEAIVSFGYRGMSPALMGGCAERDISLCVLSPQGRFLARVTGRVRGNVLLRRKQYQVSMNQDASLTIARNCILGKVYNARWVLERAVRDHGLQIDTEKMKEAAVSHILIFNFTSIADTMEIRIHLRSSPHLQYEARESSARFQYKFQYGFRSIPDRQAAGH